MENETKKALFIGGIADGSTKEIDEVKPQLGYGSVSYISRGSLDTKKHGKVQLYVLQGMNNKEEVRRIEKIKAESK